MKILIVISRTRPEKASDTLVEIDADGGQYARHASKLLLGISRKLVRSSIRTGGRKRLPPEQALFLVELAERGTICVRKNVTDSNVFPRVSQRFVRSLARRGLVNKTREWADKRVVCLSPSAEGRDVAEELLQGYLEAVGKALEGASHREREAFLTMLTLIDESFA